MDRNIASRKKGKKEDKTEKTASINIKKERLDREG